jgi:hypothetical protein
VLGLILIFVVVGLALTALLWGGTTWFQAYIYSEPAADLYWRAPAAAGALTLFLAFWGILDYRSPGDYPGQFGFEFQGKEKDFPELWAVFQSKEVRYQQGKNSKGQVRYFHQGRELSGRPDAVIIEEQGEKIRFDAERDANGYFKAPPNQSLRYLDGRGRVMTEGALGFLPTRRWGLLLGNMLLNLFHFALWFACAWLLLRFQWTHALGLALVFWLIMTFTVVELLMKRVEEVKQQRVPTQAALSAPAAARTTHPYRMCMISPSCTT